MTSEPATAPRPFWTSPVAVLLIVSAFMLPRFYIGAKVGLLPDEAYYALWSVYPGFAYYDHSPAVAWFVAGGRWIFGEGPFAVRSLFLFSTYLVLAAVYRLGIVLFRDARVAAVAAIWYAAAPMIMVSNVVATPDGPSELFWILSIWAVAEFTVRKNPNWWLAAGALAGLGLLSKYTVLFLGIGLLLWLLSSSERRRWFRHWQLWAGALLAVALFSPVIWWNYQHDWSSFRFQFGRSTLLHAEGLRPDETLRFQLEEAILMLPPLFIFTWLSALLFAFRRAGAPASLALPVLTALPMVAYFILHSLFGRVNPNWTIPFMPQLALIGAWGVVGLRPRFIVWRALLAALRWTQIPLGILVLVALCWAVTFRFLPFVGDLRALDQVYRWSDFEAEVSAMAKANGAQWVETEDYSFNGWLGYAAIATHDPLPVYQINQPIRYTYMPPIDPVLQSAPHLLVQHAAPQQSLTDIVVRGVPARPLGLINRIADDGHIVDTYAVYLVGGVQP